MVFRSLIMHSVTKRIPLIKFRKGGLVIEGTQEAEQVQAQTVASTTAAASMAQPRGPTIEDWELPERYWRKPIDQMEMDYINTGGPE